MKKIYSYLLLLMMLPIVAMMQSCDEEEIVFESDIPRFELRGDRILLEALVPSNTPVGDEMYIVGAINGGDVDAVVGNPVWQLEKAADYDYRYGIYLDPATFAEGTSLADGYYIYSASQREERTLKGDSVMHSADAGLGERITINVNRWASYFSAEEAPVHDGYAIYVIDNSGYDALALYAYGDGEIFGVWPGILPTGTEVVDGTEYIYFDAGEANSGMSVNLIFNNNNNGSQLADFPVVLDRDYYLELTPDGVVEIDQSATIEHDGYAIFFEDLTGWDALYMYAWVDGNPSICGEWPGVTPTGEVTINGVNYKYFDTGAANVGQGHNIIMNNNGDSQFDLAYVTLDRDYYYSISATGGVEIEDPQSYTGGGVVAPDPEPEPDPEPAEAYTIYVEALTGWSTINMYSWGEVNDIFGSWPGMAPTGTTEIDGITYTYWEITGNGEAQNLIFNDGTVQAPDFAVTLDRDYYLTVTATSVIEKE